MLRKCLFLFLSTICLSTTLLSLCNGQSFEFSEKEEITTAYPGDTDHSPSSWHTKVQSAVSSWYNIQDFPGEMTIESPSPFTAVFRGKFSHQLNSQTLSHTYEATQRAVPFLPPRGTDHFHIQTSQPECVTISTTFLAKETVLHNAEVIERNEWGAEKPKNDYAPQDVDSIIIHHSWYPDAASYREAESIAGIQRYHMYSNGWDDVGYHYLIGPDGLIFRGRPENAVGAHCVPNTNKIGICMIGNYDPDCDEVTPESWNSLEKLTIEVSKRYDVPPDMLFGHRDFSPKSCPGEAIYSELPAIREKLPFH